MSTSYVTLPFDQIWYFFSFWQNDWMLFRSFRNELLSRSPTHIIPLPFKNGSNCLIVELLGIVTSAFWSRVFLMLWVLLKIFLLEQTWSTELHFLEVGHCHVMVLLLHPSLFFLGESAWTLTPKTWLSSFYPMLVFSLPISEVCQKILLCSLFWVPSLILDRQMIHQKTFCYKLRSILIPIRKKDYWTIFLLPWYYLHLFLLSISQLGLSWCLHQTTGSHKNFHRWFQLYLQQTLWTFLIGFWCNPKQLHYLSKLFLL